MIRNRISIWFGVKVEMLVYILIQRLYLYRSQVEVSEGALVLLRLNGLFISHKYSVNNYAHPLF